MRLFFTLTNQPKFQQTGHHLTYHSKGLIETKTISNDIGVINRIRLLNLITFPYFFMKVARPTILFCSEYQAPVNETDH